MGDVEFRLLGQVEMHGPGGRAPVAGGRSMALLAMLLLHANQVVPVERLVESVWDDHSPEDANGALQRLVFRLRRSMDAAAPGGGQRIVTEPAGYLLRVRPGELDLEIFRAHVQSAQAAVEAGQVEEAAARLRAGLTLWRGSALTGVPGRFAATQSAALADARLSALEQRIEVDLRLGLHAEAVEEIRQLIAAHPLRERLRGQLMVALYRDGRQAEALQAFQDARRVLLDELGTEPNADLQRLHERVLRGDAELASAAARRPRRNDLPRDLADFTGRQDEVARLLAALPGRDDPPGAMVISAIDGMAGIGKTALAVHLAHRLVGRYTEAQLFIDLHGHTPGRAPTDPIVALDALLRAVGVPGGEIPQELESRSARWRAELAGRDVLLVLDNAADAAQVRPLLPGTSGCLTVITSRRRLVDLESAHVLSLDVLPRPDAIALFERIAGRDRATVRAEVDEVVALCGDLPLAIRIAAARLRARPTWTVADLAERLRNGHGEGVAAAFTLSCEHLTDAQLRMFRLLGAHPGPDIDAHAAAALTGTDPDTADQLLEELVDVHLLHEPRKGRYRLHDLLRRHARDVGSGGDLAAERQAARARLVDFYLHTACGADRLLHPHRVPIKLETAACTPRPLRDEHAAEAWFTAEHSNLLAVQRMAAERAWLSQVWQLAWAMDSAHWRRGHLNDSLAVWREVLTVAERLDDRAVRIRAHSTLGHTHIGMSDPEAAVAHLNQALRLVESTDTSSRANIHRYLALACEQRDDLAQALEHATQLLELRQKLDKPVWEADAHNLVGWLHARLGQYEDARTRCEAALDMFLRHDFPEGAANTLDTLGYIAHLSGAHADAQRRYREALAVNDEAGHTFAKGNVLEHLGEAHRALGQHDEAREAWQQALDVFQDQQRHTDATRVQRLLDDL